VLLKDHVILTPMASLELCTDRMSGFIGPDKSSNFCNYYVEPHLPASCGALTFGGRMMSYVKTSSREQGHDFDLVGTCEWLSYVRAFGSQAYGELVRFFPCRVYIDSSHHDTLGYEWQLVYCSYLIVCFVVSGLEDGGSEDGGYGYVIMIITVF
jgi:hypothetical protein